MFEKIRIKDVFQSIQPFYIIAHVVGMLYYKIYNLENGQKIYKVTLLPVIRYLLGITMYSGIFLFFIRIKIYFPRSDPVFHVLLYGSIAVKALALTNLILGGIMYKKIVYIINEIDRIDKTLLELGINVKHWKVWVQCILGVVIGSITLCYLLYQSYTAYRPLAYRMGYFVLIPAGLSSTAPLAINGAVLHQYSLYCRIIEVRYSAIHTYLKSVLKNYKGNKNVWISEDLQPDIKKQRKFLRSTSESLFIVDTVASYHIKLADIAAILNQAFCVQLLLLITTSFLGIVTALFLIAINFKQPLGDDSNSYNFVFTAWAFSNTIALLVVVHTTCALCDEANKCPRILHKIRNNTNDAKLHTTIEMYSLQMYHNRLQFHVCGLFPLDYTLLYTIVAGVTTHLVILIQFNSFEYGKKAGNESMLLNYTLSD